MLYEKCLFSNTHELGIESNMKIIFFKITEFFYNWLCISFLHDLGLYLGLLYAITLLDDYMFLGLLYAITL